jgi:hypothetical protein
MGMLDKLFKRREEPIAAPPLGMAPPLAPPEFQSQAPGLAGITTPPLDSAGAMPSPSFPAMPSAAPQPAQEQAMNKDLQLISAKLDTLRVLLDSLVQRLDRIEQRLPAQEQAQPVPRYRQY